MRNLVGAIVISGVCLLVLLLPLAFISKATYSPDVCLDVFAKSRDHFAPLISCVRDSCPDQSLLSSPSPCITECLVKVDFEAMVEYLHHSPELVVSCRERGPSREMSELLEIMICAVYGKELRLVLYDLLGLPSSIAISSYADFIGRMFQDCQWSQMTPGMCRFLEIFIERSCPSHHRCSDLETLRLERCAQKD